MFVSAQDSPSIKLLPAKSDFGQILPDNLYPQTIYVLNTGGGKLELLEVESQSPHLKVTSTPDKGGFYKLDLQLSSKDLKENLATYILIRSNDPEKSEIKLEVTATLKSKDQASNSVPDQKSSSPGTSTTETVKESASQRQNPETSTDTTKKSTENQQNQQPTTDQLSEEELQRLQKLHEHKNVARPIDIQVFFNGRCMYCTNLVRILSNQIALKYRERVLFLSYNLNLEQVAKNYQKIREQLGLPEEIQMAAVIGDQKLLDTDKIEQEIFNVIDQQLAKSQTSQ